MAQTGYTPILIYSTSTAAAVPTAGSLTNSTLGSELAINITDGKLFYKDNANAIQVIGWKVVPATAGGTGLTSYAQGDLLYYNSGTTLTALPKNTSATRYLSNTGTSNNPAWAQVDLTNGVTGTLPVANGGTGTATAFTTGSVVFAGASGVYSQDNANLFWDDTNNRLGIGTTSPQSALSFASNSVISVATLDGSDNGIIALAGGGASSTARGGLVECRGNEATTGGLVDIASGNVANSFVRIQGRSSTSDIRFLTNATEAMRIFSSQGVSIGNTTDPGATNLSVTGLTSSASFVPTGSAVPTNGMFLPAANTVAFSTNTTERSRFDSSGRLLIGALSVRTGFSYSIFNEALGSPTAGAGFIQNSANVAGPAVSFGKTRGTTVGSVTSISGGDVFGQLLFSGADGTGMIDGASIIAVSDGTPATNAMPGRLVFSTTASGASSVTERMRIDSNGFVGVGVTSPAARLHLGGAITASSWTTNGIGLRYAAATYTDSSTAASGTVASSGIHALARPTIAATNATVTYTNAATLYIANSPANGSNVTVTNPWSIWVDDGNVRFDGNQVLSGLLATSAAAPTIASATTIAPTTRIAFVSGTTAIATITAPAPISSGGGQITLIPTGLWTTNTTGNIALASTAVVSRALIMTYDVTTAKWYPSY